MRAEKRAVPARRTVGRGVASALRAEIEDPGRGDSVVRRPAGPYSCGGSALQTIKTLSERSGSERRAQGASGVWAQVSLDRASANRDLTSVQDPGETAPR